MLKSPWIRKPDFRNIDRHSYKEQWEREHPRLGIHLKPRENIILRLIPRGATVLDLGCGASRLPLMLFQKGVHVSVADISPTVLKLHKEQGIECEVLDIENISALKKLKSYDYIILSEVLEHTRFPEEIVMELKKHTERFLLTVPNSAAYVFRYGLMFRGRFFTQWMHHPSEHLRFWSHKDFIDWLSAMGIVLEKVEAADGFTLKGLLPFLPRLWKNLFGYRMVYLGRVGNSSQFL